MGGGHGAGAGQGTDFLSRPRVCRVYGMLRDLPGKQTHQEALECYLLPPSTSLLALSLKVKVAQSCPTLCDPVDYTVHGILRAKILEWVAVLFSRGSSQPKDQTQVSHIAGGFFTSRATQEALINYISIKLEEIIKYTRGRV